jgi:hypothetical protein
MGRKCKHSAQTIKHENMKPSNKHACTQTHIHTHTASKQNQHGSV